jgi:DNA (cytosine-5)-methyltransferase 1
MTFIDLFAGVGGFRKGMELAGHKCMGFCEWDKFATASYTSMHLITDEQRQKLGGMSLKERQKEILKDEYRNGEWYSPDIRQVGAGNVPRVDCWCFGAPCQDFSIAGKRAGLDGDRSSLIREVFRVLGELEEKDRPEWLIYENVKGMLSSNRGGDFLSIILAMEELGYDIEWQVFNSKYHGVPQNRERVYTLGHLRTRGRQKVFPLCGADGEDSAEINIIAHYDGYRRNTQTFDYNGITEALSTCEGGGREHHTAIPMFGIDYNAGGKERQIANTLTTRNVMAGVTNIKQDGTAVCVPMCIDPQGRTNKEVQPNDTVPTLRAQAHGNNPEICIPVLTPDRVEKRQNGRRFKDNGEEAFTLTAQDRHGVAISEVNGVPVIWYEKYNCYIAIRKLTPKECFRLQGWTDDYFEKAQFVNSDSQLYKQAGNGVTVNVVEDIARAIGG